MKLNMAKSGSRSYIFTTDEFGVLKLALQIYILDATGAKVPKSLWCYLPIFFNSHDMSIAGFIISTIFPDPKIGKWLPQATTVGG